MKFAVLALIGAVSAADPAPAAAGAACNGDSTPPQWCVDKFQCGSATGKGPGKCIAEADCGKAGTGTDKTVMKCQMKPAPTPDPATPGKAAIGGDCDSSKDNMGCADGARCNAASGAGKCVATADCDKDGATCGAMKIAASAIAALAIASAM